MGSIKIFPQVIPIQNFLPTMWRSNFLKQVPHSIMTISQTEQWVGQALTIDPIGQRQVVLKKAPIISNSCVYLAESYAISTIERISSV
jgi:hypothetical protein